MRGQDLARLVALAAMWGASYLFMRFAVPHLGPIWLIELRVLVAGLALLAFVYLARTGIDWRRDWKAFVFVGVLGTALPFVMIARALTAIDASTGAILNALSPLFASLVAAVWIRERLTLAKLAGIALCLVGTAVLVGWTPAPMTREQWVGSALSVGATMLYGVSIVYSKVRLEGASPMGISAATLLVAAAALMPLLPASPMPTPIAQVPVAAWIATAALAIVSTTVAFIFYYRLVADVGPVKAITVTLLVPVFGMLWGVLFLGEPVTPGRLAGCAVILAGCSLILGLVPPPRPSRQAARPE